MDIVQKSGGRVFGSPVSYNLALNWLAGLNLICPKRRKQRSSLKEQPCMSFSSRLSSMVERNVTAEELGTSESAPPPLDIILPVVLLAFFLVVLIAWR